jgi:hypothetical protein
MIALAAIPAHRPCAIRSTVGGYERWTREHAVDGRIPARFKPRMWTLERCQAHGPPARSVAILWRMRYLRGQAWDRTHPFLTAVVSWYSDAGTTASGWHAADGFATCGTGGGPCLPFGARVEFCYARCVVATADDHGPYVPGRSFDLAQATAGAIGFDGVADVRYRALP